MADVSLSGDGRMGIMSKDGGNTFVADSRARLRFSLSGETDSGLKFGGQFRANDAASASSGTKGTVFVEFPKFGRLTMGDAEGAAQTAVTQLPIVGYTDASNKMQEFRFITGGDASSGIDLAYSFTRESLGVFVSVGDPGASNGSAAAQNGDDRAIGVSYTTEFWKLAAAYEDNGVNTQSVISGSYGNGQAEVKVVYGKLDNGQDQQVVYGTYIIGTTTLSAFFRSDFAGVDYKGLGVSHDLGGGLALAGSYARKDGTKAIITLGASMSF
jgi:outer membrane protein OmpU